MIDIQTKIHDKFTLEFKVGFRTKKLSNLTDVNDFVMNTWLFIPNSLDINRNKYTKDNFYRDIKSGARLITPSYSLHNLAHDEDLLPCKLLRESIENDEEYGNKLHAIRMYCSIAKSSIRDAFKSIRDTKEDEDWKTPALAFIADTPIILTRYRQLRDRFFESSESSMQSAFRYGDEFLSNILEQYGYRLREYIRLAHPDSYTEMEGMLKELLVPEKNYKKVRGYLCVQHDSADHNSRFVYHASLLKKFAESDLFLHANKSQSTFLVEQILYSAAAGVAMIFATVASFFFQQKYGNFTFPFLIALVVSYMFKDRIKDWLRMFFAKRLSSKVFDTKSVFHINKQKIGWSKDSFDFIDSAKVPEEVLKVRSRTTLLQMVSGHDEKVILYRKKVQLHRKQLAKVSPFPLNGINDNIRFNITEYLRKMDNPDIPLLGSWEDNDYAVITGGKVYYLNFVIQCIYEGQTEYKRIIVGCTRDGITSIQEM